MALLYECIQKCEDIGLHTADIVRDGDVTSVIWASPSTVRNLEEGNSTSEAGHIYGLLINLTHFGSVAPAVLIPKFYDLPAWLRITLILLAFCTTYPTAREKTEWGRRIHLILRLASVGFFLLFVRDEHLSWSSRSGLSDLVPQFSKMRVVMGERSKRRLHSGFLPQEDVCNGNVTLRRGVLCAARHPR
jgi:hypothetical protein